MAEFAFTLEARPILGGADLSIGANRIVECDDLALVSVATPLGGDADLANALKDAYGIDVPDARQSTVQGDMRAIRTAPDQIMLVFPHSTPDANAVVQSRLNGAGYTTDQSDNWVVLEATGPDTLTALERLCLLDVRSFPDGGSGRTVMEHMGALIVRLSAEKVLLLSASSSAPSFLHAVENSYRNVVQD